MRIRLLVAILAALTVGFTGCGGDSKSAEEISGSFSAESEERSSTSTTEDPTVTTNAVLGGLGGGKANNGNTGNASAEDGAAVSTTTAAPNKEVAPPVNDVAPQILSVVCRAGRVMTVRAAVPGSNAGLKWGVVAVEVTRVNDEGAQVATGLRWSGATTGAGDEWSNTIPGGSGWSNSVTVMATTFTNKTTRKTLSVMYPC